MIKFETCIRCGSPNTDCLMVNNRINLNYPEKKNPITGTTTQRVIQPTTALLCKDCGHIELLVDWEEYSKDI
jgi:hypothetical protein